MAAMTSLTSKDLRTVLDLVHAMHADDRGAPPLDVLAELGQLVGADVSSYTRVEHRSARLVTSVVSPVEQNLSESPGFHSVFHQHPALAAYRAGRIQLGRAVAMSELAEPAALRRLPLYVDYYLPRGTQDQLLCVCSLDRRYGNTLAFNRSRRGFTARDREVAELITPHWAQAMDRRARLAALTSATRQLARHADRLDDTLAGLPTLTRGERLIVEQLLGGLTDREIARCLEISPRTVHKHLEHVYRKLGATNRASLIAILYRTGVAPRPDDLPSPRLGGRSENRLVDRALTP
jgi:DNA-binding CsgD family transcriptional regulator